MLDEQQIQTAVDHAFERLVAIGKRKGVTHFEELQFYLLKTCDFLIDDSDYKTVLRLVNVRSWSKLKCLLTVLVLCSGRAPKVVLDQARKLGAIFHVPKRTSEIDQIALKLQQAVYNAVCNTQQAIDDSKKGLKPPALF